MTAIGYLMLAWPLLALLWFLLRGRRHEAYLFGALSGMSAGASAWVILAMWLIGWKP